MHKSGLINHINLCTLIIRHGYNIVQLLTLFLCPASSLSSTETRCHHIILSGMASSKPFTVHGAHGERHGRAEGRGTTIRYPDPIISLVDPLTTHIKCVHLSQRYNDPMPGHCRSRWAELSQLTGDVYPVYSLMLGHRRRRWPSIKPTLDQCLLLARNGVNGA